MTQIAKEYMQKMGITDTQYLLVRHLDQPHPHCHLVNDFLYLVLPVRFKND